jgi:hypothetical protein
MPFQKIRQTDQVQIGDGGDNQEKNQPQRNAAPAKHDPKTAKPRALKKRVHVLLMAP